MNTTTEAIMERRVEEAGLFRCSENMLLFLISDPKQGFLILVFSAKLDT